jgi:hypothetical protein
MFLKLGVDRTIHLRQRSRNTFRLLPKGISQLAGKVELLHAYGQDAYIEDGATGAARGFLGIRSLGKCPFLDVTINGVHDSLSLDNGIWF